MDLILKSFALGALAECPSTSQEESFHISFTLYIYYIIFFYKNQISTFALDFYFAKTEFYDITLLYPTELHPSYQGSEDPLSSSPTPPCQVMGGMTGLEPATCGTSSKSFNCCYRLLMEKVVWRKKAIRAYHFLYLTYILYHIFFEKSKKILGIRYFRHRNTINPGVGKHCGCRLRFFFLFQ